MWWTTGGEFSDNPRLRSLRSILGKDLATTSEKAGRVLGRYPRPVEDTIAETAGSLLAPAAGKAA